MISVLIREKKTCIRFWLITHTQYSDVPTTKAPSGGLLDSKVREDQVRKKRDDLDSKKYRRPRRLEGHQILQVVFTHSNTMEGH